jgi:hypothetical protein
MLPCERLLPLRILKIQKTKPPLLDSGAYRQLKIKGELISAGCYAQPH